MHDEPQRSRFGKRCRGVFRRQPCTGIAGSRGVQLSSATEQDDGE
jgi:hypothetical protein